MIDYAKIDTTINIGGIAFHQPITSFTDYLIVIICFLFYNRLKQIDKADESTIWWKRFYLFLSGASLFGGSSHAFFMVHEGLGYDFFWKAGQLLNIFAAFAAQQATLYSILKNAPSKNYWKWSYQIQLVVFSISVFAFHTFSVVIINSAIALIPVMIIHFIDSRKINNSQWVGWGIVILFITAIINGTKISVNQYFTYLDIAHIFIITSLSVMFFGIKRAIGVGH